MEILDKQIINFINALAMPVHQGGILICGDSLAEITEQLSSSIEITTRILYNVKSDNALKSVEDLAFNDIRVAVHQQEINSFLTDVQQNMFNLIVLQSNEQISRSVELAQTMLTPDGYLVIVGLQSDKLNNIGCDICDDYQHKNTLWCQSNLCINAQSGQYELTLFTPKVITKGHRTGRGRRRRQQS